MTGFGPTSTSILLACARRTAVSESRALNTSMSVWPPKFRRTFPDGQRQFRFRVLLQQRRLAPEYQALAAVGFPQQTAAAGCVPYRKCAARWQIRTCSLIPRAGWWSDCAGPWPPAWGFRRTGTGQNAAQGSLPAASCFLVDKFVDESARDIVQKGFQISLERRRSPECLRSLPYIYRRAMCVYPVSVRTIGRDWRADAANLSR